MNEKLKIISRASHDRSFNKLKRAGADNVIMPDKIGGTHMAGLILKPDVIEFMDVLLGRSDSNVEEIDFSHTGSKFIGKSIAETRLAEISGVNIIGMKLDDGTYKLNPQPDTMISKETKIFILGMSTEVEKAFQHLS
jgi:voltage-gated potassium channel